MRRNQLINLFFNTKIHFIDKGRINYKQFIYHYFFYTDGPIQIHFLQNRTPNKSLSSFEHKFRGICLLKKCNYFNGICNLTLKIRKIFSKRYINFNRRLFF